ncbi:MAG: TIGR02584 family CRISPR-associated protein [Lentisphaerae bacterium]|nr:TIGR02584 family CRISPR-associated protein [Lentisphaerota bacterium]
MGVSPSVLTETLWALALESPPVLPDRIVVLTTRTGRTALEASLFSGEECGWSRLCAAFKRRGLPIENKLGFGLASDHVRIFPSANGTCDLDDIATSADNATAADFILRHLRAETDNSCTRVLASIAGGRKTMGALLMACMSLVGREQDRVLHVLVNPPYDTPLDPPFLFPTGKDRHRTREGKPVIVKPKVDLIDVPFVKMRGWYESAFKSAPPSYAALVRGFQRVAPPAANAPRLTLDGDTGVLCVAGSDDVALSPTEFAVVSLMLRGQSGILKTLCLRRRLDPSASAPEWLHAFCGGTRFTDESIAPQDFSKCLSSARSKFTAHPMLSAFSEMLLPKRGGKPTYPTSKIVFRGIDFFADIHG